MNKKKNPKYPALRAKKKALARLNALKYCCIPKTVVKTETIELEDGTTMTINPDIKWNGNGIFGTAGNEYKKMKADQKKQIKRRFVKIGDKYVKAKRSEPWYVLSRKPTYVYEERKYSWGTKTDFFKAPSEYFALYRKTIVPKFTKEELIIRLLSAKLKDWEAKNPKPSKDDMFYWQEMQPWINRYQAAHSRIAGSMGLLSKTPVPQFVKDSYEKYEKEFKKEYEQHWQETKAA